MHSAPTSPSFFSAPNSPYFTNFSAPSSPIIDTFRGDTSEQHRTENAQQPSSNPSVRAPGNTTSRTLALSAWRNLRLPLELSFQLNMCDERIHAFEECLAIRDPLQATPVAGTLREIREDRAKIQHHLALRNYKLARSAT